MGKPRASIDTLRALSAMFLLRVLHPVFVMVLIIMIAAYALMVMLTLSFSAWWLLLLIILLPLSFIVAGGALILRFAIKRLLPRKLNHHEERRLKAFTETLLSVAKRTQTPYFILLFLVAKDVLRGRESAFLRGLIGDSKRLMKEFGSLQHLFEE